MLLRSWNARTRRQSHLPLLQHRLPEFFVRDSLSRLRAEEEARCKQVAWQAAESREMWEQFRSKHMTTEPVKLDESGIQLYLDQQRFDTVEVAIPSGGLVGWHPAWISVTVARGTYEVLGMRESFWP